jgi:predicted nuclease of restriction endonuclease-like (RecB) superfamily
VQSADYVALLEAVKDEIAASRVRAARAVNAEMISMYWRIGALIFERQAAQGWGCPGGRAARRRPAGQFPRRPRDQSPEPALHAGLRRGMPEEVPQPVAQLRWGHVRVLLDRLEDHEAVQWYATRDAAEGWSRAVLETMVASRLHLRQGVAPSNFSATLPGADSDVAQEITRDPYVFDFVRLQPGYRELDVQAALVAELRRLLQELGTGFAIVGERWPLVVGDSEFFPDLLCYHTRLHRLHRLRAQSRPGRARAPRHAELLRQRRR